MPPVRLRATTCRPPTPSATSALPQARPDLQWLGTLDQQRARQPAPDWARFMVWAPRACSTPQSLSELNYLYRFTRQLAQRPADTATATDPTSGLLRIKNAGCELGLWWGRSLATLRQWNPTLGVARPDNFRAPRWRPRWTSRSPRRDVHRARHVRRRHDAVVEGRRMAPDYAPVSGREVHYRALQFDVIAPARRLVPCSSVPGAARRTSTTSSAQRAAPARRLPAPRTPGAYAYTNHRWASSPPTPPTRTARTSVTPDRRPFGLVLALYADSWQPTLPIRPADSWRTSIPSTSGSRRPEHARRPHHPRHGNDVIIDMGGGGGSSGPSSGNGKWQRLGLLRATAAAPAASASTTTPAAVQGSERLRPRAVPGSSSSGSGQFRLGAQARAVPARVRRFGSGSSGRRRFRPSGSGNGGSATRAQVHPVPTRQQQ